MMMNKTGENDGEIMSTSTEARVSISCPDNMIMVPSGSFIRGTAVFPDEGPVSTVYMDSFAMDIFPVTNDQFALFIASGGYDNSTLWSGHGWEYIRRNAIRFPNYWHDPRWNQGDHPVTGICWWEAMAYASFAGKMLPTEAQWEYACRGTDGRTYPWGNDEPTLVHANYAPGCDPAELKRSSTAIDAYPRNKSYFGCSDMAGNLAEWCLDNASPDYSYDLTHHNPVYITREDDYHIARGGCGLHNETYLRCSSRDNYPATVRDNLIGFRCVVNDLAKWK